MTLRSAIYAGHVVHARHRPHAHKMRYRVFSLLLDLDELPLLDKGLRLFGYNRWSVFSFHDSDHGVGEKGGLKRWVAHHLADADIDVPQDKLRVDMLCYPRIFGYVFNPLTVYFCHDEDRLVAILYEVRNTFHERHTYIIPTGANQNGTVRHSCAKEMYVSPFVPMECTYDFRILPPSEKVLVAINERDQQGDLLFASFAGERRPLTGVALLRALLSYPLMTLKIMGAIHWEALLLWAKGNPIYRHKAAKNRVASSIVAQHAGTMGDLKNEPR
ncbi:hypothetical protein DSM25558_2771 [Agrobacterium sp. DSM 25558]|uniref:DUF1365 domain-containing protein n=1 Tax=Agrobacterium sp. DSM 25558 TaxID=1907665 RepID=UPI0009724480|nr:DUF1365 domain-containing protein [Agrobacterium sp. DSM 25558]SCX20621.1 hypothetical protein DSM25558_2771 [Agrobacterium sp. DSM 25558]